MPTQIKSLAERVSATFQTKTFHLNNASRDFIKIQSKFDLLAKLKIADLARIARDEKWEIDESLMSIESCAQGFVNRVRLVDVSTIACLSLVIDNESLLQNNIDLSLKIESKSTIFEERKNKKLPKKNMIDFR